MDESGFIAPARPQGQAGPPRPGVGRRPAGEADPLLRAALDGAKGGLIVLDQACHVRLVTRRAAEMLGLRQGPRGAAMHVMRMLAASPLLEPGALQTLAAAFEAASPEGREIMLSLPTAEGSRVVTLDVRPAGGLGWVVSLEDVTQTRQARDWLLEHLSSDPVTGLWNRQHFLLMLRDRLDVEETCCISVLMVSLQRFRGVRQTLGSEAGDALLRLVGGRLRGFLREDDMVARTAGEEFAIALAGPTQADAVASVSDRLAELIARPYMLEGQLITLGASIGIARAPDDGHTADSLFANAALALMAATADANGGPRFFEPRLTDLARHRRALEADLRRALARAEFELHYQPQVDMHRPRVTGLEALIRWRNPERGMVSPTEFIPLAEEIGLICAIGDWVLLAACEEAAAWPDDISVAVNASPLQFETGNFAGSVANALERSGLSPHRLEIEITESLLLRDNGTVLATLAALHGLGVRLVLDDFGTGYASLSQLSRFRFDKIKIDRSFISAPDAAVEGGAIVRSIAALGISLGIPTTAEGVETAVQLRQIRADGCSSVQGYYFSKPVPAQDVPALLVRLNVSVAAAEMSG